MSVTDEVIKIAEDIDALPEGVTGEQGMRYLNRLSEIEITLDIITASGIGLKVNALRRKTSDEKLSKKAKALIKEWKNIVEKHNGGGGSSDKKKRPNSDKDAEPAQKKSKSDKPKGSEPPAAAPAPVTAAAPRVSATFSTLPRHLEMDDMRLKSATVILSALRYTELPQGTLDPEDLAIKIEEKLYSVHKTTNQKYAGAVRSRVFNLRDKKNPALRDNVLTGVIQPEVFATMSAEDMASDEIRQQREKFNQEGIKDHQMTMQQGTPSDMFKCGKCLKKNCTYTQLQTRSSDEPMTTFVFCLECGNRWKFC